MSVALCTCIFAIIFSAQTISAQSIPPPPATGLRFWLKADAGVTRDINGLVSSWANQVVGSNSSASQSNATTQPLWVANALNGQPVVRFDGSNDYVSLPNFMSGATAGEVFIVLKSNTDQGTDRGLWRTSSSSVGNEGYNWYPWSNGDIEESFGRSVSSVRVANPPVPLTTAHIHNVASASGSYVVRQNGAIIYSSQSNTFGFRSDPLLGVGSNYYGDRYYYGDVAEMIVYDRVLSETERDSVQLYLGRKYGLMPAPVVIDQTKAIATSESTVTVSWIAPQRDDPVYYSIERRTDGGDWTKIGESRGANFMDQNLDPSTDYEYRIRMVAGGDLGDPSTTITVRTLVLGFAPIPSAGIRLWLDAGNISPAASGGIAIWPDRVIENFVAVQNGGTIQPIRIANALNGQPVVRFDGSNDYFSLPDFMSGATAGEVFIVLRSNTDQGADRGLWRTSAGNVGNEGYNWYPWSNGDIEESFGRSGSSVRVANPPVPLTSAHIHNVASANGSYIVRQNGAVIYSSPNNAFGFRTNPLLGVGSNYYGDRYYYGDIAELIVYDRVLSATERDSVQLYLGRKYGLVPPPVIVDQTKAIATSESTVIVSWVAPQRDDLVYYSIERRAGGGDWMTIGESRGTNYIDQNLIPGAAYEYRVRMVAGGEFGEPSVAVLVETLAVGFAALPSDGIRLWLDAGKISPAASPQIAVWPDRLVGNSGAVQLGGGLQPVLVANALNGQPVVRFDGSNDYFSLPDFMSGATAGEVFIVLRSNTDQGADRGLWRTSAGNVGNEGYNWYPWSNGDIEESFGRSGSSVRVANPPVPLTSAHIHNVASATGTYVVRQNGAVIYSSQGNAFGFRSNPLLGVGSNYYGDRYYYGDVAEMIVYDRVLSETERDSVQLYLGRKYGLIPAPVVIDHAKAIATSGSTVTISWGAPQREDQVYYSIERRTGGGEWLKIGVSRSATYVDENLAPDTEFEYRVRMVAGGNLGEPSATVTVRTLAAGLGALPLSGMRLWLDAGSISAAATSDVAIWPDRSGVTTGAFQFGTATRPLLVADAMNGQPVVRFDGTNDYFNVPDFMSGATAGEVFIVLKSNTDQGADRGLWRMSAANVGNEGYSWYPWSNGDIEESFGRSGSSVRIGNPPVPLTEAHLHNVASENGSYVVRQNGAVISSSSSNGFGFRSNPLLGVGSNYYGDRYYYGDVAEMIAYSRVLTNTERDSVNLYLFLKYNIGLKNLLFAPSPGFYNSPVQVTLFSPSAEADVYYTIDGTTPSPSFSPKYTGPLNISASTEVRAQAFVNGVPITNVTSSVYAIGRAAEPITSVSGLVGEYFETENFDGSSTRRLDYTLNNPNFVTLPTRWQSNSVSVRYQAELIARFTEQHTFYLKTNGGVRLWLGGTLLVDDWNGTISRQIPFSASLVAGTHYPVRIEFQRKSATVELSLEWSGFSTIREIIPQSQWISGLTGGIFAGTPTATPAAGIYGDNVAIALSTTSPVTGARFYYTLDGSDPTSSSALYTDPLVLHQAVTLKARTFANDLQPSGTLIALYQIDNVPPVLSNPTFDGAALSGSLTANGMFGVTATDSSGVKRVDFKLDGTLIASDTIPADGFNAQFDIDAISDGAHVLTIQAWDMTDIPSTVLTINLSVALPAPPAPVITVPTNNQKVNQAAFTVRGTAQKNSAIVLFRAGTQIATATTASDGTFNIPITLAVGDNDLSATAANRNPLPSVPSASVRITFDNTVPAPPTGVLARSRAAGQILIDWTSPASGLSSGFYVFRSSSPIPADASFVLSSALGGTLVHGVSFTDTPPTDGHYYYRVMTGYVVGQDVTLSPLSNQADAISDRVLPTATVKLEPLGQLYDSVGHRYGRGLVQATLTTSEPLAGIPFLNLATSGGSAFYVDLTPQGDTTYTGVFTIAPASRSGSVNPILTATDVAGNRGTQVTLETPAVVDTHAPEVSGLSAVDVSDTGVISEAAAYVTIKNDPVLPATAVTLHWLVTLDEAPKAGTTPNFTATLSGHTNLALPLTISDANDADTRTWLVALTLPADAGVESEMLTLNFTATDDLDNSGSTFGPPHAFQVYKGSLPPLPIPQNFTATALPAGAIRLNWILVDGAAAYVLQARGPADADFVDLQTVTATTSTYAYTPATDGLYTYRVASVRLANGQDSTSGWSDQASARADRVPPAMPSNLIVLVIAQGVKATWNAPTVSTDVAGYALYRSPAVITSIEGLTPAIGNIPAIGVLAVDAQPSGSAPYYALVARDAAGNISAPATAFANVTLLPVATLSVVRTDNAAPVVSWTLASGSVVDGYNLAIDSAPTLVNGSLLIPASQQSYADSVYTTGDRLYGIKTLSGPGSRERTLLLQDVSLTLVNAEIKRGLMNTLGVVVRNLSTTPLTDAALKVRVANRDHASASTITLAPGAETTVPIVVGGYDDLSAGPTSASISLVTTPHQGETATVTKTRTATVVEGALTPEILPGEFIRGGHGQVKFKLTNPSSQPIELKVARAQGTQASDEVRFKVLDGQGAILSTTAVQIALGENIIALPDGTTVVRIPAGGSYTSPTVELPLPAAAPALVTVTLEIDSVYFNFGVAGTQVKLNGPRAQAQVSTIEASYSAQILSTTPALSNGAEPVVISGRALWRGVDPLSPTAGATSVPVVISIRNQGFIRQQRVTTDSTGAFTYSFQPGIDELGGIYEVWASHPDALTPPDILASFTIRRVVVTPRIYNIRVPRNYRQVLPVQVSTGAGTTVQNLRAELQGTQPAAVVLTTETVPAMAEQSTITLPLSIMGVAVTGETTSSGSLQFRVLSDNSAGSSFLWETITVNYEFTEAQPLLQVTPTYLQMGLQPSQTTSGSIVVKNQGFAPLDGGTLSLVPSGTTPLPAWIRLQTPANFGSLDVGAAQSVTIAAAAPSDALVVDQVYSLYLRVAGTNAPPVDIPVTVTLAPQGNGSAVFKIVDPYFQLPFANGATNSAFNGVSNASVVLEKETSTGIPSVTRAGNSDASGEITFADLPAGRYKVRINADRHEPYISRVTINPGILYAEQIQLTYTPVTFTWEVVPVTFQDVYNVVLTATFETNVPVPVVVVEPGVINLPKMCAGQVYSGEFRITNHGLIDAENVSVPAPASDENFSYEFQTGFGDKIKAGQTVVIPYKVTCLKPLEGACPASVADATGFSAPAISKNITEETRFGNAGCIKYFKVTTVVYEYHCINGLWYKGNPSTSVGFVANYGDCPGGGTATSSPTPPVWISNPTPGGTPPPTGLGIGGPSGTSSTGASVNGCFPEPVKCPPWMTPCECKKRLDAAGSSVDLASRQYVDSINDLAVAVPGGTVTLSREFSSFRWHFSLEDDLYALHSTSNDRYSLVLNGDEYLAASSATNTATEIKSAAVAPGGDYLRQGTGPERITKNADGTFTWTDTVGATRTYDATGKLTTIIQSGGVIAAFNYAANGTLASVSDRDGRTVLTTTYTNALLTQAQDFTGRTVSFVYDSIGRLTTVTDVYGDVTTYGYDDGWELTSKREHFAGTAHAEDHIETIEYHRYNSNNSVPPLRVVPGHTVFGTKPRGQVMSVSHNFGARHSYVFNYDETKRTYYARVVTAGGREEESVFDANGILISRSVNGSSVYRFEQADRVRVTTVGGTQITTEEIDERGNVTRRTNPDGAIETYSYDPVANLVSKYTDPAGVVTTYAYDGLHNEITKTEAVGTSLERVTISEYYSGTTLLKQRTEPSGRVIAYTYDSSDRLTRVYNVADPLRQTTYTYDSAGNRTSETDALGRVTTWRYDSQGRLVGGINPLAESTVFTYVGTRIVERETGEAANARGRILRYSYDSAGRKTKETRVDAAGAEHTFKTLAYDADGHTVSEANALGQITTYSYDASGNQASASRPDADGNPSVSAWSYDLLNRPTQVVDVAGSKRTTSYDLRDRPTRIAEAVGTAVERSTQTSFDLLGRITQIKQTDVREPTRFYITTYTYDSLGRRTAISGDRVYAGTTVYDAGDRVSSQTDALGRVTSYDYDINGRPLTVRLNGTVVATYTYDLVGNRISVTDGVGNHRHFRFDVLNRVTDESIPLLATQSPPADWWTQQGFVLQATAYTSLGEVASQTRYTAGTAGVSAATISASYDVFGRKISDTDPAGLTRNYTYDDADYLLKVTYFAVASSGANEPTSITYLRSPANCELIDAVVDRAGNTTHYAYDNALHQTQETNSLGGITVRTFDPLGRVASLTDPSGNATQYEYDLYSQSAKITYPDNVAGTHERIETFRYDNHGKLVEKAGAGGYPLAYAYDAAGNLTSQTDANGHTTRWSYTARNQVATKIYADSTSFTCTYDDAGRLKTRLDAMGRTTNYTFNAYALPTLIDYPTDSDVSFTYDQQGHRTKMVDGSGTTNWTYDAAGRPLTETQGRSGRTLTFSYDSSSERIGLQVAGGASAWNTSYGYDNSGRLHTVLDDRLPAGQPYVYTYAANANLVSKIATPTGLSAMKTYDTSGRLASISALNAQLSTVNSFSYTYDNAGQRNLETGSERTRAFTYDAQRQLTQSAATSPNSQLAATDTYAFDGIGNRLTSSLSTLSSQLSTSYTTNSVNQYTALAGTFTDSPVYDFDGNTTALRGRALRYDEENRLIEVSDLTRIVVYIHDGLGRRVERIDRPTSGSTIATRYVYDGWRVVEETDASGVTLRSYTRGLDLSGTAEGAGGIGGLLALTQISIGQASTTASYFYDGNGDVTDLVNDDGTIAAHYTYSPFGERLTATGALADINAYQFSSKERDGFTRLYYYGYRFYDPVTGRWLTRDPIQEEGGNNLYVFVGSSPSDTIDFLGLSGGTLTGAENAHKQYIAQIGTGLSDFGGPVTGSDDTRGFGDGPRYGNWGGKRWSGGYDGTKPPIDSSDQCYKEHDLCYTGCDKLSTCDKVLPGVGRNGRADSDRTRCIKKCDETLAKCLKALPKDPREWPQPPPAGQEGAASRMSWGAQIYFGLF